jgi:hypothetical protein
LRRPFLYDRYIFVIVDWLTGTPSSGEAARAVEVVQLS